MHFENALLGRRGMPIPLLTILTQDWPIGDSPLNCVSERRTNDRPDCIRYANSESEWKTQYVVVKISTTQYVVMGKWPIAYWITTLWCVTFIVPYVGANEWRIFVPNGNGRMRVVEGSNKEIWRIKNTPSRIWQSLPVHIWTTDLNDLQTIFFSVIPQVHVTKLSPTTGHSRKELRFTKH